MQLDIQGAKEAIVKTIAEPLGLDLLSAAWGIHQVVNENMAGAARIHAIEQGKDPRSYPLFAFGGAGPVHAFNVARILRSRRMVVPMGAGVTSTIGFLTAPLAFDFVRTYYGRLADLDWEHVNTLYSEMESEGRSILRAAGLSDDELRVLRSAEMRYVGQGHEIVVEIPDGELSEGSVPDLSNALKRSISACMNAAPEKIPSKRSPGASSSPGRDLNCHSKR